MPIGHVLRGPSDCARGLTEPRVSCGPGAAQNSDLGAQWNTVWETISWNHVHGLRPGRPCVWDAHLWVQSGHVRWAGRGSILQVPPPPWGWGSVSRSQGPSVGWAPRGKWLLLTFWGPDRGHMTPQGSS